MTWQTIDSAPKDRPVVIGWREGNGDWTERRAYWDRHFEYEWDDEIQDDRYRGAWTDNAVASWGFETRQEYHPTHWMPLPDPPDAKETAEREHADETYLQEVADGAYGDNSMVRGLARYRLRSAK